MFPFVRLRRLRAFRRECSANGFCCIIFSFFYSSRAICSTLFSVFYSVLLLALIQTLSSNPSHPGESALMMDGMQNSERPDISYGSHSLFRPLRYILISKYWISHWHVIHHVQLFRIFRLILLVKINRVRSKLVPKKFLSVLSPIKIWIGSSQWIRLASIARRTNRY